MFLILVLVILISVIGGSSMAEPPRRWILSRPLGASGFRYDLREMQASMECTVDRQDLRPDTLVTHIDRRPGSPSDIAPALHQTATFRANDDLTFLEMATTPRHEGYYTRYSNPTIAAVESAIAALEGAETSLLTASGMSAMSTAVLGLVRMGDHVVGQRS